MDGVKSVAPVYGKIERKDGEGQEKAADDDPMGLESAFDQAGPVCQDVPPDDDPLGLDAAFDVAVPCAAGGASDTLSEDVPTEVESLEGSQEDSDRDLSDPGDGEELGEGDEAGIQRIVQRMRRSPNFSRVGKKVMWGTQHLGSITAWGLGPRGPSVGCVCRVHAGCRAPASTRWGADMVLEKWLLEAIHQDGSQKIDRDAHMQTINALHATLRANLPSSSRGLSFVLCG